MTPRQRALTEFRNWYDGLTHGASARGAPKGAIAVGLVLLERLKDDFNLRLQSHLASGKAQIKGVSSSKLRKILASFGEMRRFSGEAGRTNRGTPAQAEGLLKALGAAGLGDVQSDARTEILRELQGLLVERVREFHGRQRLKPVYDPAKSTRQFISDILELAEQTGKRGPVAQYLVGAKLQLRFPGISVRNESYAAADDPTGQPGDFVIADTTFHVTITPSAGHFEKCKHDLQEGRRVFVLVPDDVLEGARQNAEIVAPGRIAVESIESFVANSMEMEAACSSTTIWKVLLRLSETFNDLVLKCDPDEWMTLDIQAMSDEPRVVVCDQSTSYGNSGSPNGSNG